MRNNLSKLKKKKKGFTLIELIVVIAILGILAAIAVPKLVGFKDSAKAKADQSNAKVLDEAIQVYNAEKDSYPSTDLTATGSPTAAQVTALETTLKTNNYLSSSSNIVFNNLAKVTFTVSSGTVTAVTYTP